ncbi:alpha/beta hydrolase [Plantactinospora sp. BC1]|nr:alpha/beta hydrolase [Plantactinospora sp. BC1]AVT37426.1 alpha/beta hydrolase [Plantactinospora sp. BB1]
MNNGSLHTAEANGILLAYRVAGDPARPPMVLLHGLGDDERDWQDVLPHLAEDHRVYALDLRGHGRSARPGHYSFELMCNDVISFLDVIGIERCVLIGHSMGAVVATLVAQTAAHRLTHLVLEDATPPRPGDLARPPLAAPDEPTPYDFAAVNAVRKQLDDPDPAWWDGTAVVNVPTLIVGGAHSSIPQSLLAATADRMPDATLVTIAAGHYVHQERPAEFLAAVDGFLAARPVK